MAYTIGASHGPFTGTGNFVIAKPAGIRSVVTGIPFYTGHDGGSPRRYFRLGRYTLGNTDGFQASHALEYEQQLLYPIPDTWELLAYDIRDGASCLFQELVAVPDLTAKQPWDRTPLFWQRYAEPNLTGGTSESTGWTYTVPTGRRLMLAQASVRMVRVSAATSISYPILRIQVDNSNVCVAVQMSNVVGTTVQSDLSAGPLVVNAGSSVKATYSSSDTGGNNYANLWASGYLFDA